MRFLLCYVLLMTSIMALGVSDRAHPVPQDTVQLDTSVFKPQYTFQRKYEPIKKVKPIHRDALTCLAKNVYFEAAEEGPEGRLAVATVTMNRVESGYFPSSVCGVVYQRGTKGCQFSWTCGPGRRDIDPVLYRKAEETARQVLYQNARLESIGDALYFHRHDITPPSWVHKLERIGQVKSHVFYAYKRK
jgi:spore germination cell wall hydrolase CwlJ-like protein